MFRGGRARARRAEGCDRREKTLRGDGGAISFDARGGSLDVVLGLGGKTSRAMGAGPAENEGAAYGPGRTFGLGGEVQPLEFCVAHGPGYLRAAGSLGDRPYLRVLDLSSGEGLRVWTSNTRTAVGIADVLSTYPVSVTQGPDSCSSRKDTFEGMWDEVFGSAADEGRRSYTGPVHRAPGMGPRFVAPFPRVLPR